MPTKRDVTAADDPFAVDSFRWGVAERGYRWDRRKVTLDGDPSGKAPRKRVLVPVDGTDGAHARVYLPSQVPELYRVFAATEPSEAGVLQFANEYGPLGLSDVRLLEYDRLPFPKEAPKVEMLDQWGLELHAMRCTLRVWDALSSADSRELSRVVATWRELVGFVVRPEVISDDQWLQVWPEDHPESEGAPSFWVAPGYPTAKEWPVRRDAAWVILNRELNAALRRHSSPSLELRPGRPEVQTLRVSPVNLIGAMWWQFARTVMGEASYRRCKTCGRTIELSSSDHGFRADREFCSGACKAKDYRAKVKRARELKSEGRTAPQIAKALGTTTDKVKAWLEK